MSVGLLPASYIELLGDGTTDGDVLGDPSAGTELAIGVIGGNLVRWISPWQIDVDVPLLGGADFNRTILDVTQSNAAIKAILASYYATLLQNPNFIDAITGTNAYVALVTTSAAAATPGFLPASYIELLGDGTSDGDVIGDPIARTEIAEGVIGGNLVEFVSPYQFEVALPTFGGARFRKNVTDVTKYNAVAKALASAYVATLLSNPGFVDAITGVNSYVVGPITIVNKTATYPAGGSARTFAQPSLTYPAAGVSSAPPIVTPAYPAAGVSSAPPIVTPAYPAAGVSSAPPIVTPAYPAAGTYFPWSNSNSLALAYATDQFL